jgi:hypothetical protein
MNRPKTLLTPTIFLALLLLCACRSDAAISADLPSTPYTRSLLRTTNAGAARAALLLTDTNVGVFLHANTNQFQTNDGTLYLRNGTLITNPTMVGYSFETNITNHVELRSGQATNEAARVSGNATNHANALSVNGTNEAARVSGNATNHANALSVNGTNEAARVSGNATNHANALSVNGTNEAARVSGQTTQEVRRVVSAMENRDATWPLTIPSHDEHTEVAHPNVILLDTPLNGYRWWMIMSPFPEEDREVPNVLASLDGVTWAAPAGLTNPLVLRSSTVFASGWLADPEITQLTNGMLAAWWCDYGYVAGTFGTNNLMRSLSSNGVNWSTAIVSLGAVGATNKMWGLVGPSIVQEANGTLTMWVWSMVTNRLVRWTSSDMGTNWSNEGFAMHANTDQPITNCWHGDVVKVGTNYYGIWDRFFWDGTASKDARNHTDFMVSSDGTNWTVYPDAIPLGTNVWANGWYKCSLVPRNDILPVFDVYLNGWEDTGTATNSLRWKFGVMRDVRPMDLTGSLGTLWLNPTTSLNTTGAILTATSQPGVTTSIEFDQTQISSIPALRWTSTGPNNWPALWWIPTSIRAQNYRLTGYWISTNSLRMTNYTQVNYFSPATGGGVRVYYNSTGWDYSSATTNVMVQSTLARLSSVPDGPVCVKYGLTYPPTHTMWLLGVRLDYW